MKDSFITLAGCADEEIIVRNSRFIGHASPCVTEEEALSFLNRIRESYRDATHNCYAYIIGDNSGMMRYSDDGEPGGTAGLPMLDVLKKKHIVNACVVITRYFGGTLLGTGGLVRAYTQCCQSVIQTAGIAVMELTSDLFCTVPYAIWDKIRFSLRNKEHIISDVSYTSMICFHLLVKEKDCTEIINLLNDVSSRQISVEAKETVYRAWRIEDNLSD